VKSSRSFSCKAILFDLDGVLVNSTECVERTWRAWAARHHLDPEKIIAYAHGRRTIETVQLVAPELSADEELRTLESSEAMTAEGVYEVEGARELLESLPQDRWAIVTSGVRPVAEFRIRLTGLPSASVMICADDISRGKPDPEGYLKAAVGLRQSPADCIVIEDAPAGIEAAHNAGMQAIGIAATYPRDRLLQADAVVKRLADLAVRRERDSLIVAVNSD
jgi:mannitol-1-/sugar-/sorbitol-6-phosphatase